MRKESLGIWGGGGIDEEWVVFVSCKVQSVEAASPVFEAWVDEEKDEAPKKRLSPSESGSFLLLFFRISFLYYQALAAGSWKLLRIIQKFKKFKGLYLNYQWQVS